MVFARSLETGRWEFMFKGYRDSVGEDEIILEMEDDDGCLTMGILLNATGLYA